MSVKPPVEKYVIEDKEVYVVREDLLYPFPGPNNSKIVGIEGLLERLRGEGVKAIATQNTRISRLGWGISYLCRKLDLKHYEFYPDAGKKGKPFYQRMSERFGAITVALRGTHARIFNKAAEKWLKDHNIRAFFLPNALALPERVEARIDTVNDLGLNEGTIVVPSSSGVIAASVIHALRVLGHKAVVYAISSSFTPESRRRKIREYLAGCKRRPTSFGPTRFMVVSLNRKYGKPDNRPTPFPSDVYLDRAPFWWMVENYELLPKPAYFWNVGGEWDPIKGLGKGLRGDGLVRVEDVAKYVEGDGYGEGG